MKALAENLERLEEAIAAACRKAGRPRSEVELMAVSKTYPASTVIEAASLGLHLFGENRVQEWQIKRADLADLFPSAQVHLIGPLQNNKTSKAAEIFDAIDTLDSLKTAERLNAAALALNKTLRILIEVKLSPEDTKHGLAPEDLPTLLRALAPFKNIQPRGLMTVPPFDENPETARPYFQHLRQLRDDNLTLCPALTDLSMGMSNDFAVAIEEGSTTVRIGTAIFGKRVYPPSYPQ